MNTSQLAIKLESMAVSFEAAAHRLRESNSPENTPKRQRQGMSRRIDAAHNERAALACRKLAEALQLPDQPLILGSVPITKTFILDATRKRMGSTGYYEVHEEDAYSYSEPAHQAIQALIDPKRHFSPEELERQARDQKLQKLEEEIRFSPIPGFFPTPPALIQRMIAVANLNAEMVVLEPSAGKGDICDAILKSCPGIIVECFEINPKLREILLLKGHNVLGPDCLNPPHVDSWDCIIMNPPFENGQDIDHVRAMYDRLNQTCGWGKLVAIMSTGAFYRKDKKATEFREWLSTVDHAVEDIGPDAFKGRDVFRETGTNTKLVVIKA